MGQAILAFNQAWEAHNGLAVRLCTQLLGDLQDMMQTATAASAHRALSLTNCWAAIFCSSLSTLGPLTSGAAQASVGTASDWGFRPPSSLKWERVPPWPGLVGGCRLADMMMPCQGRSR